VKTKKTTRKYFLTKGQEITKEKRSGQSRVFFGLRERPESLVKSKDRGLARKKGPKRKTSKNAEDSNKEGG